MFHVPEQYRVKDHPYLGSDESDGNNGLFVFSELENVPFTGKLKIEIRCIASDGRRWEHVSVSLAIPQIPSWNLMCKVKSVFWDDEDNICTFLPNLPESKNKQNAY